MSKIRTFFIIGIVFLLFTGVLAILGVVTGNSSLVALSELFVIISMVFMLWGYVVTLESINEHVSENVELMKVLINTIEKGK
ncbi:MAG: hypothetical protein A4E38_01541 [Methanoregulaceae archaeon PtaB.Bin108]|jgi:hypothetical protein|nr:MAG: hypothetical protein A4E38_01541 [Methanoregulaceae archaeon PtaB.Bin108]OPY43275.1 MAG: hypothetical protein A4E42_01350 [Methanoregulaceae archaeon PtaU1.Bin222]